MKVLLTGAQGFLGWHTRVRLTTLTDHEVVTVDLRNWKDLSEIITKVDAVVHIAGTNRASPDALWEGNVSLAQDVGDALRSAGKPCVIVFANTILAGEESAYGQAKGESSRILEAAASAVGSRYVDVRLPNLFGEHGRPRYNSFVQTFVECIIEGRSPSLVDRELELLYVQEAAQLLISSLTSTSSGVLKPTGTLTTVLSVYDQLKYFDATYRLGDVPELATKHDLHLFNTLRAARFPQHYPILLTPQVDNRGRLVEVVRSRGGEGQTFVSTTKPAIVRGNHYHLRKMERFVVLEGKARISLRRLFTTEVVCFEVSGDSPAIVDMPTMWVHNLTNIGTSLLTTLFWTNELYDPDDADTYPESVGTASDGIL